MKLDSIFADTAMICQVVTESGVNGLALFNKEEFIDRMTLPAGSLRNLEILGTKKVKGKIVMLRFRINDRKR